jgi:hypothetical protein
LPYISLLNYTKKDKMTPPIEVEKEPEVLLEKKMNAQRKVKKEPKEKKSKVVMPRGKNSKPNAKALQCARKADDLKPAMERPPGNHAFLEAIRTTAHHVRAQNEDVMEKSEGARVKRWPKNVIFVRKLPPITQPTMEREWQRWQRHLGRNIVVPDDRLQFAMELADLPFETIMSM